MNTLLATAAIATASLLQPVGGRPRADPAPMHPHETAEPGVNRALAFDGADDFVTVPACDAMRYPGQGGWTVELWVKPVVYPFEGEVSIVGQESVGIDARDPWSIRAHPTHFEFRVDDAAGRSASLPFDLALGVWQHIACVYDDTNSERTLSVYVNGTLLGRERIDIEMESRLDPVYMGALWKHRFTGIVDEVRVWSAALDHGEVGLALLGGIGAADARLRGWWSFDESRGPIAFDRSLHGSHAVLGKPHESTKNSKPTRVLRTDTIVPHTKQ